MRPKTFDIFNTKIYTGPNPYLNTAALVFDFSLFKDAKPLKISDYVKEIAKELPQLSKPTYKSYADLLAGTLAEATKLEMELHFDRYSVTTRDGISSISVQSLDHPTTEDTLDFVWDWLEAITENLDFDFQGELRRLQELFRRSVYGGPTVYSILKTAYQRGIPSFYLPDEGLLQYGYGKYQVRGVATTFTLDSQLDSDFTTRKDDCKTFLANCGFPVPSGKIVSTLDEAKKAIKSVPVAVKPVVGHPKIDLLLVEYPESIFVKDGMFYEGSNIVVLDKPTEIEKILAEDLIIGGTLITREYDNVTIEAKGLIENYKIAQSEPLTYYCVKEINRLLFDL